MDVLLKVNQGLDGKLLEANTYIGWEHSAFSFYGFEMVPELLLFKKLAPTPPISLRTIG